MNLAGATIIFQDDFSSGNLNNWTIYTPTWAVVSGELYGSGAEPDIGPNTGNLSNYTLTHSARFADGLGWRTEFIYIDNSNKIGLWYAVGAPDQLDINVYENNIPTTIHLGSISAWGTYTTHYAKYIVNRINNTYEIWFGNSPTGLTLLYTGQIPASFGANNSLRFHGWGYPGTVQCYFDNVLVSIPDELQVQWTHTYDDLSHTDDYFYCVQATEPDHGYVMTGFTTSSQNGTQIRVMKTDQNGNTQWDHVWGGQWNDCGRYIEQTSDGGYIVTGFFYLDSYNCEAFLLKLNANGNEEWLYTYGHGIEGDVAECVRQTSDRGFIVAGGTFGSYIWDFWLFKVNSSGTLQWQQTYNMPGYQSASFVSSTSDGGYIISGYTTPDPWNALIVKTNSAGQIQWQNNWGANGQEKAECVRQLPDGNYLVSGFTSSYGAGGFDGLLYKISSAGTTQWYQTYGGAYDDLIMEFQLSANGQEVNLVGTSASSPTANNLWYLKTNLDGSIITTMNIGGANEELGNGIDVISDGGAVLAGGSKSFGSGDWDSYLVKLGNPTLDVNIWAASPPITIPANGGSFNYYINVQILSGAPQTFTVWNVAKHNSTNIYYPMFGPVTRTLPGNASATRLLTQWASSALPAGDYTYISYIGSYPNSIVDSSYFSFTKSAVDNGGPWVYESKEEGDFFLDEYNKDEALPLQMTLQAAPNPFNPSTTITYTLPAATRVKLSIYNIEGSKLATLVDGFRVAGVHQAIFDAAELPSGIYIARVEFGGCSSVQKMVLMK